MPCSWKMRSRFIGKIISVAVEGDADLVQFGQGVFRLLVQQRRGHVGVDRGLHVVFMEREEQADVERCQVGRQRGAAREARRA